MDFKTDLIWMLVLIYHSVQVICLLFLLDSKTDLIPWPYEEIPDQQLSFFDSTDTHLDYYSSVSISCPLMPVTDALIR